MVAPLESQCQCGASFAAAYTPGGRWFNDEDEEQPLARAPFLAGDPRGATAIGRPDGRALGRCQCRQMAMVMLAGSGARAQKCAGS